MTTDSTDLKKPSPARLRKPVVSFIQDTLWSRLRNHAVAVRWIAVLLGTVAVSASAAFGLWFAPFVAGVLTGLTKRLGWSAGFRFLAVLVMAAVGWAVPLFLEVLGGEPVGAIAKVTAALAGLPPLAAVGVVLTLIVGILQAVLGLWLASSLTPGKPERLRIEKEAGNEGHSGDDQVFVPEPLATEDASAFSSQDHAPTPRKPGVP